MPPAPKPPPGWYPHPQSSTGQRYWTGDHWGPPPLPPRPTGPPMPPRRGGLSTTAWIWTGLGAGFALLMLVTVVLTTTGDDNLEDGESPSRLAEIRRWCEAQPRNQLVDGSISEELVEDCIDWCQSVGDALCNGY